MKKPTLILLATLLVTQWANVQEPRGAGRYESLLASSAGRDSLRRLALWEDGRVTGNGRLFQYLRSNNPLTRLRAVEVIGRIQDPQDVPHLAPMLKDPDGRVVREVIFALGQIGSEEAVPDLIQLNQKSTPKMQQVVAEALGKIGGKEAVEVLIEMLHAFQGSVRASAALALARAADEAAVPALLISIHDGDSKVAWRAIYALEKVASDRVREAVVPFLESEDPSVRAYAARTLGKQKAVDAVDELVQSLSDPDPRVVINAVQALATILDGSREKKVVAPLGSLLRKHPSHHVRKAAVMALGKIGHKSAKDYLAQSILDDEPGIRSESYTALAKVMGKNSVIFLSGGVNDSERVVRAAALEGLGVAGAKKKIPELLTVAAEDHDPYMRAAAVRGLSRFESDEATTALTAKLTDEDWVVAAEAARALGSIGDKTTIASLIDRFTMRNDRVDTDVRLEIMKALTAMGAEEAKKIALGVLEDSDIRMRLAASELLDRIGVERGEMISQRAVYERDFDPGRKADLVLPLGTKKAILQTERGDVEIELFGDDATQTSANFTRLARSGFYKNLTFHRVVPNFVIQGGCPRGDGWGDPGYYIRSEFNQHQYERGVVGIAHSGKDTGGCQFFITHSPQPHLDGRYTIFGRVTKGLEVVDRISQGDEFSVVIID